MFKKNQTEKSGLDIAIDQILSEMQGYTAESDEYAAMVDQLDKLYKMKTADKPSELSKDTLAIVAGNLVAVIVIIAYEQHHVMMTKAMNFLVKFR